MKKPSIKRVLWSTLKVIVVVAVGIALVISMIPFGSL